MGEAANEIRRTRERPPTGASTASSSSAQKKPQRTLVDKYLIGEELGRGAYGRVYKGICQSTGRTVAIKAMSLEGLGRGDDAMAGMEQEIELLKSLKHRNIVQYLGSHRTANHLYIVLEFVENGSIAGLLRPSKFGPLPETLAALFISQVLEGLRYLHSSGVIHNDVKGANILTTKEGEVKLADFGVATLRSGSSRNQVDGKQDTEEDVMACMGTPYWMAPEVIVMDGACCASDIWSVGCTVVELVVGQPPYFHMDKYSAMYRIAQQDSEMELPANISPLLADFLSMCFQREPARRATPEELMRHPWLKPNHRTLRSTWKGVTRRKHVEGVASVVQRMFTQEGAGAGGGHHHGMLTTGEELEEDDPKSQLSSRRGSFTDQKDGGKLLRVPSLDLDSGMTARDTPRGYPNSNISIQSSARTVVSNSHVSNSHVSNSHISNRDSIESPSRESGTNLNTSRRTSLLPTTNEDEEQVSQHQGSQHLRRGRSSGSSSRHHHLHHHDSSRGKDILHSQAQAAFPSSEYRGGRLIKSLSGEHLLGSHTKKTLFNTLGVDHASGAPSSSLRSDHESESEANQRHSVGLENMEKVEDLATWLVFENLEWRHPQHQHSAAADLAGADGAAGYGDVASDMARSAASGSGSAGVHAQEGDRRRVRHEGHRSESGHSASTSSITIGMESSQAQELLQQLGRLQVGASDDTVLDTCRWLSARLNQLSGGPSPAPPWLGWLLTSRSSCPAAPLVELLQSASPPAASSLLHLLLLLSSANPRLLPRLCLLGVLPPLLRLCMPDFLPLPSRLAAAQLLHRIICTPTPSSSSSSSISSSSSSLPLLLAARGLPALASLLLPETGPGGGGGGAGGGGGGGGGGLDATKPGEMLDPPNRALLRIGIDCISQVLEQSGCGLLGELCWMLAAAGGLVGRLVASLLALSRDCSAFNAQEHQGDQHQGGGGGGASPHLKPEVTHLARRDGGGLGMAVVTGGVALDARCQEYLHKAANLLLLLCATPSQGMTLEAGEPVAGRGGGSAGEGVHAHVCHTPVLRQLLTLQSELQSGLVRCKVVTCLRMLSLSPHSVDVLQTAGVVPQLAQLLLHPAYASASASRSALHPPLLHFTALATLHNLAAHSPTMHQHLFQAGLIPHLFYLAGDGGHLGERVAALATPLICNMVKAPAHVRGELWRCGAVDVYLDLLQMRPWETPAMVALSTWVELERERVEPRLLSEDARHRLVTLFSEADHPTFTSLLPPFLKLMVKSRKVNTSLALSGLVPALITRLRSETVLDVQTNLIKMVRIIYEHHPRPKQLIMEHNLAGELYRVVQEDLGGQGRPSNAGAFGPARQMAHNLLKALEINAFI